jgi:hypothetical protein
MVSDFLWEGKRHWVQPVFIYSPFENGGLGVKNNFIQYLIFKHRALLKGLSTSENSYFIRNLKSNAFDIFFHNVTNDISYARALLCFNEVNLKFCQIPKSEFDKISISHKILFNEPRLPYLLSSGCKNIRDANNFKLKPSSSHKVSQARQIFNEIKNFEENVKNLQKVLKTSASQSYELNSFNNISNSLVKVNRINNYLVFLFSKFKISQLSVKDLSLLREKKMGKVENVIHFIKRKKRNLEILA